MDEPPDYADPITIPFTITIPDPRPQQRGGRWDSLGPAIHPSVNHPDYFRRQAEADERMAAFAARPLPAWVPAALPGDAPTSAQVKRDVGRAGRRLGYAAGELGRGEFGAAAGHLLLGMPFPAEVDDPAIVVRNEAPEDKPKAQLVRSPELDAKTDEADKDFEDRLAGSLDSRHVEDAKNDRLGQPIVRGGKVFDHENEVAQSKQGIENKLKELEAKIRHNDRFVRPKPADSLNDANKVVTKIHKFLEKLKEDLPNLQVRQGNRNG